MRSRRNKTSEKRSQPWDEIDSVTSLMMYTMYAYNIVATVDDDHANVGYTTQSNIYEIGVVRFCFLT